MANKIQVEAPDDMMISVPGQGVVSLKKGEKVELESNQALYEVNGGRMNLSSEGKKAAKEMGLQTVQEQRENATEVLNARSGEQKSQKEGK